MTTLLGVGFLHAGPHLLGQFKSVSLEPLRCLDRTGKVMEGIDELQSESPKAKDGFCFRMSCWLVHVLLRCRMATIIARSSLQTPDN